jgi:flagellar motor protein MotB
MNKGPQIIDELIIWQASELARRKKYVEAEAILGLLDSAEKKYKAIAYDLLGRIMIKKKKYTEAKTYFQKAVAFDPDNMNPREALEYLPNYLQKRRLLRILGIPSLLLLCSVGVVIVVSLKRPGATVQSSASQVMSFTSEARLSEEVQGVSPKIISRNEIVWPAIIVSGVTTNINQTEMKILFDKGLYVDKCDFEKDSPRILRLVAEKLRRSSNKYFIIIEGHTDNIPVFNGSPYKNNFALGLRRAEKVVAFFHEECGLSENILLPISMGAENPLFSNSLDETRANNRTVSIRIIPTK